MRQRDVIFAYITTLIAIVILTIVAAVLVGMGKNVEALASGAAITGLIGVLGTFKPRPLPKKPDDENAD